MLISKNFFAGRLSVLLLLPLLFSLACSDDPDPKPKDLCADVTCEGSDTCDPSTGECVPCAGDECPALCLDVVCDRGVCDVATGVCANDSVCTIDTEETDCVEGYACYGQQCVDEATFCADLTCPRGICSLSARACIDSPSCENDMQCLVGNFCVEGSCLLNQCDEQMVNCPRGVCDGLTAECVNSSNCSTQDDCLDGNYCVGTTCTPAAEACATCTGNQQCNYDGANTVTCAEADSCSLSLDCLGDRVCRSGQCQAPMACQADSHEPNNTAATATDWFTAGKIGGEIRATLCQGDEDFFTYDLAQDPDFTGTLLVRTAVRGEDIGLGEIEVELLNAGGTVVARGVSTRGILQLTYDIGVLNQGIYTARLRGAGLATSGIRYGLYIDLLDASLVTACANAPAIQASQSGNTISGASILLRPTCVSDPQSPEDVYLMTLTEPRAVSLKLLPGATADLTLSIRTACEIDQSETLCLNTATAGGEELLEQVFLPGTYYVVVHAANASVDGAYTLEYSAQVPICTPADNRCENAQNALVCNNLGTSLDQVPCSNGCDAATGTCVPNGDTCAEAFVITSSTTITDVNIGDLTNTINLGSGSCTGFSSAGPEAIYEVRGAAGDLLEVTMTSTADASLYILTECGVPSSCVVGSDRSGPESVAMILTGTPVYVVADHFSGSVSSGSFTLEIQITTPVCTPGEVETCQNGAIPYCNAVGQQQFHTCSAGFCDGTECGTPNGDTCYEPIAVIGSTTFTGVPVTGKTNSLGLTSSGCTGRTSAGPDTIYAVTGTPGHVLEVTMNPSTSDASLYILSECGSAFSCQDGSSSSGSGPETASVVLTQDPVFVYADFFSSFPSGTYDIDFQIVAPDCTPGDPNVCNNDTQVVCSAQGLLRNTLCPFGCSNGACNLPPNNTCAGAIDLSGGGVFTGTINDYTNEYQLSGTSCTSYSTQGRDATFVVNGTPGDRVRARVNATFDSVLYAVTDCSNIGTTCLGSADLIPSNELITFIFPPGGQAFIIVDVWGSTNNQGTGTFTLSVDIDTAVTCTPNEEFGCNNGAIEVCESSGNFIQRTTCSSGVCNGTQCNEPNGNACHEPILVPAGGGAFSHTIAELSNSISLPFSGCVGTSTPGQDVIYQIQGNIGDVVKVVMTPTTGNAVLYALGTCGDGTSCISAVNATGTGFPETLQFVLNAVDPIFVVADFTASSGNGNFTTDITVQAPVCTPGEALGCTQGAIQFCDGFGLIGEHTCSSGVCAGSVCDQPNGDVCAEAIDAGTGGVFTGDISTFENNYQLGAGSNTACSTRSTQGRDAVYRVTGTPGDRVIASLTSGFDAVLYAVSDCSQIRATCLDDSDLGGSAATERLQFEMPAQGYAFIIVDVWSSTNNSGSGVFTLTVDSQPFLDCVDGSTLGCNGTGIEYCDAGFSATRTCSSGSCSLAGCDNPNGDVCHEAIFVPSQGGVYTRTVAGLTNAVSLPFSGCAGASSPGVDSIFQIQGNIGDVVTVTMTPTGSGNAILYALETCGVVASCVAGSNSTTSGVETLMFVIPSNDPITVVADYASSFTQSDYTVAFTVQSPVCTPGESFGCDQATGGLGYCNTFGLAEAYVCSSAQCNLDNTCVNPNGDTCQEPILVTQSTTFTAVPISLTNSLSLASPSCTGYSSAGQDTIYMVQGNQGDILEVSMVGSVSDTSLYVLTECGAGSTCLAGSDNVGAPESIAIALPSSDPVFVYADFFTSTPTGTYDLDIRLSTPDCVVGDPNYCVGADLVSCSGLGVTTTVTCGFGCNVDACNPASNDTCLSAYDLSGGGTFSANIGDLTNQYQMAGNGVCDSHETAGRDAVFVVNGTVGDTVVVTVDAAFDAVLYASSDCSQVSATCVADADNNFTTGIETLTFTIPAGGQVFIFVDVYSFSIPSTGLFTIDVDITSP